MHHANANKQYSRSRRHKVRMVGINEEGKEDCERLELKLFNEKLKIPLLLNDIDRAHRVGQPKPNKSRAVIVIAILINKKKLKGTDYYINEDLTNKNQERLYKTRNSINAKSAWSRNENIFTKNNNDGQPYHISSDLVKYNFQEFSVNVPE